MTGHIFDPDDIRLWEPGKITAGEQRAIDARAAERDRDTPSARLPSRIRKATDRWSVEASHVANGLTGATATIPPPATANVGRPAPGVSDPVAAQIHATWDAVDRAVTRYAHLTGPCPLEGEPQDDGRIHDCGDISAVEVADRAGIHLDPETIVDGLLGTPPTVRRGTAANPGFIAVVHRAASWHTTTAAQMLDRWLTAWRTAEPQTLEDWVAHTELLARRMATLAGTLAAWSGRQEAACTACGGAKPDDGNVCGRCRTAAWRRRASGQ